MALIVETGAGLASAESYAGVSDVTTYAGKMGLDWDGASAMAEPALRRATRWIDNTFRGRFVGQRRFWRSQALEWPRVGVYVRMPSVSAYGRPLNLAGADVGASGFVNVPIPYDTIPPEIVTATIEAAIREAAQPNTLLPDASTEGSVRMCKVGDVTTEFFQNVRTPPGSSGFAAIDAILASLLGVGSGYTARATRG